MFDEPQISSPKNTKQEHEKGLILDHLPEGREYFLESWSDVHDACQDGEIQFEVNCRVNVKDEAEALLFLEEVMTSTESSMNIESGKSDRTGPNALIYGSRKCVMNVFHHKSSKKNLRKGLDRDCPASIRFRLEKSRIRETPTLSRMMRIEGPIQI